MIVFFDGQWKDGFLDYCLEKEQYRIQVCFWKNLERLEGLYFIPKKSLKTIINYIPEIGFYNVFRKVYSRLNEKFRNEKYLSIGLGKITESTSASQFSIGQIVAFLAPNHPPCVNQVVLPGELLIELDKTEIPPLSHSKIIYQPLSKIKFHSDRWWSSFAGWSPFSGKAISKVQLDCLKKNIHNSLKPFDFAENNEWLVDPENVIKEKKSGVLPRKSSRKKKAVLFGYGNYAKTIIIPNIKHHLSIECIHEIDPTQIPLQSKYASSWDTSPNLRSGEKYDALLIAGFHSTHAPLAIRGLQQNSCVVVEKPIATNKTQLNDLLENMKVSKGHLFSCFHKRYSPLNTIAYQDLGIKLGEPISYHCIVYEVPLPDLHWYRWPNSKSCIVSNGCHWIDHFLFLNGFCEPKFYDLALGPDGAINCSIILSNNAFFTMTLTHNGSNRVGVQEHIELRANGVTVKVVNSSNYFSENRYSVIRKIKIKKTQSYKNMYQEIGMKIASNKKGDSLESVRISSELILALDDKFKKYMNLRN